MSTYRLEDIAGFLDLNYHGDADYRVSSVAAIHDAKPDQLSFVVGRKFLEQLRTTKAGIVIVPQDMSDDAPSNVIVAADPYLSYAKVSHYLHPDPAIETGIHASASVHASADVDPSASIGPQAIVEAGAIVEAHCVIGAGCFIGRDAKIGAHSYLFANATVYHTCELGEYCRLQSGAVIGSEGFGYARQKEGWQRINQIGRAVLGDRVEIGANTTVDRGAIGDTVIEDGVILDNQIQVAHNVRIGRNTAIAGCTGIAGSTTIGSNCTIAGSANISGHIQIVDNVHLTATALVLRSITEPGTYSSGVPLETNRKWHRTFARIRQLDRLAAKINRL